MAEGNKQNILDLLEEGADINSADNNGCTALHYAAAKGSKKICLVLLDNNANIHLITNNGCTALHYAAMKNNLKIVELFLEKGIKANIRDNSGSTALDYTNNDEIKTLLQKYLDQENDASDAILTADSDGNQDDLNKNDEFMETPIWRRIDHTNIKSFRMVQGYTENGKLLTILFLCNKQEEELFAIGKININDLKNNITYKAFGHDVPKEILEDFIKGFYDIAGQEYPDDIFALAGNNDDGLLAWVEG